MIDYTKKYKRFNDGAFYGNNKLKSDLIAQLNEHFIAEQITKGQYWENGKGCHVGCCIHSSSHSAMSMFFGLPLWLCYLFDVIFENLDNSDAQTFPVRSIEAIKVGSDIKSIRHELAIWRLNGLTEFNSDESIQKIIELHRLSLIQDVNSASWSAAESAAKSVARRAVDESAKSAACSAAESASCSDRSVAGSAICAAESAAWNARCKTESAAWSAAESAAESAWSAESVKIIELLTR
jgi:hypothetical protein